MWLIVVLYLFIASAFTIGKAGLFILPPVFFVAFRMIMAGLLLLGYLWLFKRQSWHVPRAHWFLFAHIIMFHIYAAYVLEFYGMAYTNSAKVCLLYSLSPFITALLVYLLFKKMLTKRQWVGLGIGFMGMLPILFSSTDIENVLGGIGFFSWAELAILGSVVSSAYGWIVMKQLVVEHRYSPLFVNGIGMLGGGFLALLTSVGVEGFPPTMTLLPAAEFTELQAVLGPWCATLCIAIIYTFLLILVANVVGYNLYGYLLTRYSTTFLSFAGFMTPLFAALLGWIFLSERINVPFCLSFIVTLSGLYIFYKDELKEIEMSSKK